MGFKSFTTLYHQCVTPILDYCADVWGLREFKRIEAVQNQAIRFFLGVNRFAPILGMHGDTGWTPCTSRWYIEMFRLWIDWLKWMIIS